MPNAPDFRLYHGNDLAVLAGVLAKELASPARGASLLAPDTVLIPQPAMKRWLQNALAEAHGVAANLRFLTPGEFVHEALRANLGGDDDQALAQASVLRWRLWELLSAPALTEEPVFAPLRALLDRGARARSAWALAGELAAAFEKYQAWRRDWLLGWDRGQDPRDWQAELWRRATRGQTHRGARLEAYLRRFGVAGDESPRGLPSRLFAFGCQNVSPDVLRVIASAARAGPLHFFFVSPVAQWWGDLRTVRERLREDPSAPFADDEETPLLRANGAAGRDFVRLLFDYEVAHASYELPIYVPPDPLQRTGLLHRLQRDLLERRPAPTPAERATLPAFDAIAQADASLQIHACAGRLRELQVLHDRLRALLDADPTLQPRDIAVLAPDIDAYAAQVHAVFGASGEARDAIPYAVSDINAGATSPLLAAFLRLLELPRSRLDANDLLELLALPAIGQRFALDPGDLDRLREWIAASGARWGLDAAHRVALGAPQEAAYTWAWALDRLLLGHASGSSDPIAGVAPLPRLEGSALQAFDALLQLLRTLARLRRELVRARPAMQWQALLARALDDLFPAQPDDTSERRALERLRAQLALFASEAALAGVESELPPELVRDWFGAALEAPDARQPFLTGGVTFARMVPMRLIPFRVICVLGMNDGAFPRRDPVGGLNRIDAALSAARRRAGDRSLRDDDRGLFLQLFAAATDAFIVSYQGVDLRSGEELPPAVVVSELIDVAACAFRDAETARAALVLRHPLQPFAPEAFGRGDTRRFSYRGEWRIDAGIDTVTGGGFAQGLPTQPSTEAPEAWTLEELRHVLAHPLRAFLRHRLGLRLLPGESRLPDTEPFAQDDPLHGHALTQRLFALMIDADPTPEAAVLHARLLAEARVAPAACGLREVEQRRARLLSACARWRRWAPDRAQQLALTLPVGETTLQATLAPVHASGLLQFRAGKPHGRTQLDLGLEWLAWSAAGESRPVRRLVLADEPRRIPPLPPAQATQRLAALVALATRARREALPLMPRSAWTYADACCERDEGFAFERAREQWTSVRGGDGHDPWVRQALRGADPFADGGEAAIRFRTLALQFHALLQAPGGNDDDRA